MSRKSKARRRAKQFAPTTKDGVIHISSIDATLMHKPLYNGFACRGGVHGDTSYNRRKFKQETRRLIAEW